MNVQKISDEITNQVNEQHKNLFEKMYEQLNNQDV